MHFCIHMTTDCKQTALIEVEAETERERHLSFALILKPNCKMRQWWSNKKKTDCIAYFSPELFQKHETLQFSVMLSCNMRLFATSQPSYCFAASKRMSKTDFIGLVNYKNVSACQDVKS